MFASSVWIYCKIIGRYRCLREGCLTKFLPNFQFVLQESTSVEQLAEPPPANRGISPSSPLSLPSHTGKLVRESHRSLHDPTNPTTHFWATWQPPDKPKLSVSQTQSKSVKKTLDSPEEDEFRGQVRQAVEQNFSHKPSLTHQVFQYLGCGLVPRFSSEGLEAEPAGL